MLARNLVERCGNGESEVESKPHALSLEHEFFRLNPEHVHFLAAHGQCAGSQLWV